MEVRLIAKTEIAQVMKDELPIELHTTEGIVAYAARVSSPNQDNPDYEKLLKYCITHKHWSIFETVSFTVEIVTSRAISAQLLRHRSFNFQEFSQRYAQVTEFEPYEAREQDLKNRQNSTDSLSPETKQWFEKALEENNRRSLAAYNHALGLGVAKESARFLLPLNVQTKLFMTGSLRSFIHYLEVRCDKSTQKEHREISDAIKNEIFIPNFPVISKALGWI